MGFSVSPNIFTAAFELILISGRRRVQGLRSQPIQQPPHFSEVYGWCFKSSCTAQLLKRLEELQARAGRWTKPAESRSLSAWEGATNDLISCTVDGERISLLVEQPVRNLRRQYIADLSDKNVASTVMAQLSEGLEKIDRCPLPVKFKAWWYQLTICNLPMWFLKPYEITTVLEMDARANSFIH